MSQAHDPMLLRRLMETLPRFCYRFGNEIELHRGIAEVLTGAGIAFEREVVAGPRDRFDFLCPGGIVIEAKVKGSMAPALAQCARYLARHDVSAVLLVTTRHWGADTAAKYTSTSSKSVHMLKIKGASF